MKKLKVAILGAGNIGKFHVREFKNAGCDVVAILGSSEKSVKKAAGDIYKMFHVEVKQYHNLTRLLKNEKIDAVSICTPPELHSKQIKRCLEYGLHILCEKPFVFDSKYENYKTAQDLLKISKEKKKVLTVNTQWPSVLDKLNLKDKKINSFTMYMEPPGFGETEIISEAVPHMNSMLIRLVNRGEAANFRFYKYEEDIKIKFNYKNKNNVCKVIYHIKPKQERPRKINFSINDKKYRREIIGDNRHFIVSKNMKLEIEDPLKVSIRKFVGAIGGGEPLISETELLENIKLQDIILEKFSSQTRF
ncbi:Gfo/Idh/MocA family oxidoreductase [Candidatus Pacearchaeota archaeon]|nr:Gfo/Idh/MocA family oxidoreductase [Candidatus Pacearchaeota archaeon]